VAAAGGGASHHTSGAYTHRGGYRAAAAAGPGGQKQHQSGFGALARYPAAMDSGGGSGAKTFREYTTRRR
jgi:hypothetical protein